MKTLACFILITALTAASQVAPQQTEDTKQLQAKIAGLEAQNKALVLIYIDLLKDYNKLLTTSVEPARHPDPPKRPNFLESMGAAMQKQASQPPPPRLNCTASTWGNTTYTNCN